MAGIEFYDWTDLKELYEVKGLSTRQIAEMKNCGSHTVWDALHRHKISPRTRITALRLSFQNGREPSQKYTGKGYKRVKVPENYLRPVKGKYISEHILIWEKVHNKPLPKGWVVHHINGIISDNRPSNLVGLPDRKHKTILAITAQRIRELEEENHLLRKALDDGQMIFELSEN